MSLQGSTLIIVWISFLITIIGVVFSISLISVSKGGALSSFTKWLSAGIILFSVHHMLLILTDDHTLHDLTNYLDTITIIFFLIGSIVLTRTLQKFV